MEHGIDRHFGKLALAATALLLLLSLPALAQPPGDDQDDDPPRRDIRMGNTQNMRMGRDAQGNVVMEVHPPPKDPQAQPPVGPFFIYPQVGMPQGQQGGQQSGTGGTGQGGQSGAGGGYGQGGAGQGSQSGQSQPPVVYRPGQGTQTLPGTAGGQSGQGGQPFRYSPGSGS